MRRSELFERDVALDDVALVARTWERTAEGMNHILAVYGRGEAPRYPAIDAVIRSTRSIRKRTHATRFARFARVVALFLHATPLIHERFNATIQRFDRVYPRSRS